jgi:hypothetical protein
MTVGCILCAILFTCLGGTWSYAQDAAPEPAPTSNPVLKKRPLAAPATASSDASTVATETISLTVPKGTPVQVALDDEVSI